MENDNKMMPLAKRRELQILSAAQTIFAHNGYRRTTIDDITEHLRIGKGTIYRYFTDKKSLFLAVFQQCLKDLRNTMQTTLEPIENPAERVKTAIKTFFGFFDNNPEFIEIAMQARSEFKEDHIRMGHAFQEFQIGKIQENLKNGIEIGVFRQMDTAKTAESISAALNGILMFYYCHGSTEKNDQPTQNPMGTLTERAETVTALLLDGLLKR